MNLLQQIFSVRNSEDRKHKVWTILGIKLKFKRNIQEDFNFSDKNIIEHLEMIEKKLSMRNDIWQIKNVKFYLPYYPLDFIQKHIVNTSSYFEEDILNRLDKYIPDNAVILDIGANIGNHTLYWLMSSTSKVSKVYSFEPVKDTFEILKTNIQLNHLEDKVEIFNYGLNDKATNAEYISYRRANIGDTHLKPGNGDMKLLPLDEVSFTEQHVDFVKIDVESMEIPLLKGAKNTFAKLKPEYIFIESETQIADVDKILNEYEYVQVEEYPHHNWLYKRKN